jgi:hypothetical protein
MTAAFTFLFLSISPTAPNAAAPKRIRAKPDRE